MAFIGENKSNHQTVSPKYVDGFNYGALHSLRTHHDFHLYMQSLFLMDDTHPKKIRETFQMSSSK